MDTQFRGTANLEMAFGPSQITINLRLARDILSWIFVIGGGLLALFRLSEVPRIAPYCEPVRALRLPLPGSGAASRSACRSPATESNCTKHSTASETRSLAECSATPSIHGFTRTSLYFFSQLCSESFYFLTTSPQTAHCLGSNGRSDPAPGRREIWIFLSARSRGDGYAVSTMGLFFVGSSVVTLIGSSLFNRRERSNA